MTTYCILPIEKQTLHAKVTQLILCLSLNYQGPLIIIIYRQAHLNCVVKVLPVLFPIYLVLTVCSVGPACEASTAAAFNQKPKQLKCHS